MAIVDRPQEAETVPQALVGMGAYALFAFTLAAGLDRLPSIVLARAVAGPVAFPAALIVFHLRGAYFAIGTWVVAEVCRLILAQVSTGLVATAEKMQSVLGMRI